MMGDAVTPPTRHLGLLLGIALLTLAGCSPGAGAATTSLRPASGAQPAGSVAAASAPAAVTPSAPATSYTWTQLSPTTAPLPRDRAEVGYDSATGTVVVSGGEAGCGPLPLVYDDTWTWNGSAWTQVSTNAPPVYGQAAAYDGATQTFDILWFPGCAGSPEMNEWDGESWTGSETSASEPEPDTDGVMAYDPSTQSLLLWSPTFGSNPGGTATTPVDQSSTWSWDGSSWTRLTPSTQPPASIGDVQLVYDQASNQMLLFGEASESTWAWDGTDWSELSATGPTARQGANMVYDAALSEVLLLGGDASGGFDGLGTPLDDLWAWNGSAWQQLHPATSPPARFYAQMAYDDATGEVVLFGGSVNSVADLADTWVYGPPS
jgi:hypothetical protein